ncbi:hypothetical protein DFH07DRAFT_1010145 [Mycena maculata]|uniref:Uncharacterized protein n=1 Tax=Mycena maculata TaxID=230809 RepID=A0AAD7P051_9AGAR|nr:hypothetical protein DFH07DRAFT_1010145 [Mycena maculata]
MASTKAACFIGIHKAPPNLSRTEFEAKVGALGDAIAALPVAQKNLLKLDLIFENTLMDKHMKSVGLPLAPPTVVMSAEYETLDHLAEVPASNFLTNMHEMLKDPALQNLLKEADDFGFRQSATAFAADIITKVVSAQAAGENADTNVICIYHRPPHLSEEQFAQKMEGIMDKITALPIQDRLSSYTLWLQNNAVEKHLQELGYPGPEPLLVVRASAENLDHMMEIFEHSEVAGVLIEGLRDLGFHTDHDNPVYSCVFSADVATKINNY